MATRERKTNSKAAEKAETIEKAKKDTNISSDVSSNLSPETSSDASSDVLLDTSPDLSSDISPEELSSDEMETRLMDLQQEIRSAKIPVVILFEGWSAAGKGTMLGELLEGLDPRGYKVYTCEKPSADEKRFPLTRRFWIRMPAAGNISLFVGSWYHDVSDACLLHPEAVRELPARYEQIVQMEGQLIASGVLFVKFFLQISRKEQKKRLKALESKKNTRWRVTKGDWTENDHYDEMMKLYDGMMAHSHYDGSIWHVLRGEDKKACKRQMYEVLMDAFEKALAERKEGKRSWDTAMLLRVPDVSPELIQPLSAVENDFQTPEDYEIALKTAHKKLRKLHAELYRKQIPLVICFEGWDAAGKGGSIRKLTSALDPRGFEVVPVAAPTPEEKNHHYLWRFWKALPKNGHIAIFDRTWYGRVMVERIEGFCTENEWQRAYEEINQFEHELCVHGAIVRKFWLHIDQDEQLRRFEDRQNTPGKQWKITDEDWRNREKWPQYEVAVNEMLRHTHTAAAPWIVVPANNKKYARLMVLHTVINAMEQAMHS